MKALLDPIVRNYSDEIGATNSSINYNPNNIKHSYIKRRFQAVANSAVITIPLLSDQSADSLFYGVHNLSALTAVFKNSVGATLYTHVVPVIEDIGAEYFTQVDNIRSIELTCTTASTYLKLGGFDSGVITQFPDFVNSWPINIIDDSLFSESRGGQMNTDDVEKRRGHVFSFMELEKTYIEALLAAYKPNGKKPVYIDFTENNHEFIEPMYARIQRFSDPMKNSRRFGFEIEVREAG